MPTTTPHDLKASKPLGLEQRIPPLLNAVGNGAANVRGLPEQAAGGAVGVALGILVSVAIDIPFAPRPACVLGLLAGWLAAGGLCC